MFHMCSTVLRRAVTKNVAVFTNYSIFCLIIKLHFINKKTSAIHLCTLIYIMYITSNILPYLNSNQSQIIICNVCSKLDAMNLKCAKTGCRRFIARF